MSDLLNTLRDVHIAILRRLLDGGENKPGYAEVTALQQLEERIAVTIQRYKANDWKKGPEKVVEQSEPAKSEESDSDGESV